MTKKREGFYWRGGVAFGRIIDPAGGPSVVRSYGARTADDAKDTRDFLRNLARQRDADHRWLWAELYRGRIPVRAAFLAFAVNGLTAFIAERRTAADDTDLEPLVAEWIKELARRREPIPSERAKYERQVRTLIPAGKPFRKSELTKQRIRKWLLSLDVSAPNRFRAAMSSFCRYLVEEADVLESNPVQFVRPSKERKPRERYLTPADALALCQAMPAPFGAFHALLLCTAADVRTSGLGVRHMDVDRHAKTVYLRATKTGNRPRTVAVYPEWADCWRLVEKHMAANPGVPTAALFPSVTYASARSALRDACAALRIDDYTTKDHRHSCAVALAKGGRSITEIAAQLGNRPDVCARVYTRYTPTHQAEKTETLQKTLHQHG